MSESGSEKKMDISELENKLNAILQEYGNMTEKSSDFIINLLKEKFSNDNITEENWESEIEAMLDEYVKKDDNWCKLKEVIKDDLASMKEKERQVQGNNNTKEDSYDPFDPFGKNDPFAKDISIEDMRGYYADDQTSGDSSGFFKKVKNFFKAPKVKATLWFAGAALCAAVSVAAAIPTLGGSLFGLKLAGIMGFLGVGKVAAIAIGASAATVGVAGVVGAGVAGGKNVKAAKEEESDILNEPLIAKEDDDGLGQSLYDKMQDATDKFHDILNEHSEDQSIKSDEPEIE